MQTLAELQERRAYECRLTPGRALETLDEVERFLCDRGLLTRTTDSALPSLFEACHEEPYAPESPGFGQWPATKFPWFGKLGARGYHILAVHRGKNMLVTDAVARLLDPICRAEIERMERTDPDWARLLRHLARAGPSELEDLQTELGLKAKGVEEAPRAAGALRRDRPAQHRLRAAAPAHERAGALGSGPFRPC